MAHRADPPELLDIDVDELTRLFPLVTADGLRLQSAQLVQAQTTQNAADGGRRDADLGRNLLARPALAPQLLDLLEDLQRGTVTAICGWSAGRRLRLMRRPAASARSSPGARSALDRERSAGHSYGCPFGPPADH